MLIRSKKLRELARGQPCSLRLLGYCNFNPETVVACHIGKIRGMAIKSGDNMVVFACAGCHDVIDGRVSHEIPADELDAEKLRALEETQQRMIDAGLLVVH